jgi:apolipoprotein N-acyltransferase
MNRPDFRRMLPAWKNVLLVLLSAILLILAFPDFELWFLAWFGLVPLMWAVERQKESVVASAALGWLFGVTFFFGTCWWLAWAPIHYAEFPAALAYFLVLCAAAGAAVFPAIFAGLLAFFLKRFGYVAFLTAPFVWVVSEFLRYWVTGNNWNAIAYSQAFAKDYSALVPATVGGIYLVSFNLIATNALLISALLVLRSRRRKKPLRYLSPVAIFTYFSPFFGFVLFLVLSRYGKILDKRKTWRRFRFKLAGPFVFFLSLSLLAFFASSRNNHFDNGIFRGDSFVIAVQPNVPMSGLDFASWKKLRENHVSLAQSAVERNASKYVDQELQIYSKLEPIGPDREFYKQFFEKRIQEDPKTVIFPESPMNFMYDEDPEFRAFVSAFAAKNNVNVLFNSAEPDPENKRYYNSAVLVDTTGREIAQYDKIYLLPFGEAVPAPLQSIVPAFVGNFSYGKNYNLIPLGDAKAGVMICFESHFGQLSREYVRRGADVLIEMTNDGYLGPTPVLRQHLANAVFRAVETNRPVLRVTNVGITAYINERGEVLDATQPYTEDTRVWSVAKSDGSQTFYVKYGDWFAWLCTAVSVALIALAFIGKKRVSGIVDNG